MKILLFLVLLISLSEGFAACSSPILRTSSGATTVLTSTKYNSDVNTAYNRVNNLPGDCLEDGTVTTSKIANGSITSQKISDGTITAAKIATNALPEVGKLLRVSAMTATGNWTLQSDVGSVFVQLVGGGGASFHASSTNGGATSFGGHCIANGGQKPTVGGSGSPGGIGGISTGGDINLNGAQGDNAASSGVGGHGGVSLLGHYGMGGTAFIDAPGAGGGSGAFCAKFIRRENLNATEVVTIGAGGTHPTTGVTPARPGIVFIYEYSR